MENLQHLLITHGAFGLLAISFVAATIVPFSSEALVYGALRLGMPPLEVMIFASLGNCLGILFNYGLGRWGSNPLRKRMEKSRTGRRAVDWSERYGTRALLLSWLPFIGDPLTVAAGVMKVPLVIFIVVACSLRVFRYAVVLLAMG